MRTRAEVFRVQRDELNKNIGYNINVRQQVSVRRYQSRFANYYIRKTKSQRPKTQYGKPCQYGRKIF